MYIPIVIFSVEGIQIVINISISNKPSRNGEVVKFLYLLKHFGDENGSENLT